MDVTAIKPLVNTPAPSFNTATFNNTSNTKRAEVVKEVTPPAVNAVEEPQLSDQQIKDLSPTEKKRLDTVVKGSRALQNTLGIGMTFTIYRDSSGQFITRFTNKDTGAVTYIPEPNVLKAAENSPSSVVEVSA